MEKFWMRMLRLTQCCALTKHSQKRLDLNTLTMSHLTPVHIYRQL